MKKRELIDNVIMSLYSDSKYSELDALSKLFSNCFLDNLETILNNDCRNDDTYSDRYEIKEGWIDKIPLADFKNEVFDINNNLIEEKVELGDLLLVYTHREKNRSVRDSAYVLRSSRALIIQAKISDCAFPSVPIGEIKRGEVTSTSKELALLSNWPIFDLYKTSKSKSEILNNIQLDPNKPNAKFAGYFQKKWYVGNPEFDYECRDTLGSLIIDIVENRAGESFSNDNGSDWDKLVNEIIKVCEEYSLPKSFFKVKRKRFIRSTYLYSNSFVMAFFFFFFFFHKPKFRVIMINRISEEGKHIN